MPGSADGSRARHVYLDHNATTPVRPEVLEEMRPYFLSDFGNASSIHRFGQKARVGIDRAIADIRNILDAPSSTVVFTSGGTESDNLAILGVASNDKFAGGHIITSSIEHPAVLNTCQELEQRGFRVTYLPVDSYGVVDLEALEKSVVDDTFLITIMYANNEVGTIQPVEEIARIARQHDVLFHSDCVQALGKVRMNVENVGIDMVSISSHKINGPKGVGALVLGSRVPVKPMIFGGHHQKGLRPGTENVAGVVGFGAAARFAMEELTESHRELETLRARLEEGIRSGISNVLVNGHPRNRLPNTSNISFDGVEGESLVLSLDMEGIAVSTGSACSSESSEPSFVLLAMGLDPAMAQGSVRFSLGYGNTVEDIDYVLEKLPPIVSRFREMSPLYHSQS
jgi:cysteine desulfurase